MPYSYHTYSVSAPSDLLNQNGFKFSNSNSDYMIGLDYFSSTSINVLFYGSGKL